MPQVSIIVPVYKVEPYIRRCLDSIVAQTYTDWECILVDDGSPDLSGAICDEYAAKDSRFKVIHQENQGVTRARANGVSLAVGEWVNFVDPDDLLPTSSLQNLFDAVTNETAIVCGEGVCQALPSNEGWSMEEFVKSILIDMLGGSPCARLYRKCYFNEFVFDIPRDIRVGEDMIMNVRYAFSAKGRVDACRCSVYVYEPNNCGATSSFHADINYQRVYLSSIIASIPESRLAEFVGETCHVNIRWWLEVTLDKVILNTDELMQHRKLYAYVRDTEISFPWYLKSLFYSVNPVVRFFLIYGRKIYKLVKFFV